MLSIRSYCDLEKRDRVFLPITHHVGTLPSGAVQFVDWDDDDFPDILTLRITVANDEALRPLLDAVEAVDAKGTQLSHKGCIKVSLEKCESSGEATVAYELELIDARDWLDFMDVKIIVAEIGQHLGLLRHFWSESDDGG